jgi:glycopeptide antibiotics resistance protein
MMKLPSIFRHHDRELHFLFYYSAALFLNLLYAQKKMKNHVIIFSVLLIFGIGIEIFQELSNHILHRRIHGRFDPEDVIFNLAGLFSASIFWFAYKVVTNFKDRVED